LQKKLSDFLDYVILFVISHVLGRLAGLVFVLKGFLFLLMVVLD